MSLLYQKQNQEIRPGVHLIQDVNASNSPMKYTAVKVLALDANASYDETLGDFEAGIVVLAGKVTVTADQQRFEGIGQQQSVFDKIPTDSVYVGTGLPFSVTAQTVAKILIAYSPTTTSFPVRLLKGDIHQIKHRGKYQNKRLVQNILPDDLPFADKLLLVEVYTDSGNWSSYPPHRHDHDNLPTESLLEEIYYHEMQPKQGFVFQRVYTDDHSLDETMTVQNQDVVIVPKGYHPLAFQTGMTATTSTLWQD